MYICSSKKYNKKIAGLIAILAFYKELEKSGENYELIKGSDLPEYGSALKKLIAKDISLNHFRKSYVNTTFGDSSVGLGILTYKYLKNMNKNNPVVIFCQNSFIPKLVKEMGFKNIIFFSKRKLDFSYVDFPQKKDLNYKNAILLNFNMIVPPKNINSHFEHASRIQRAYSCFLNKTLKPTFSLHLFYGTIFQIYDFIPSGNVLILPFAYPGRFPFFVIKGDKKISKENIHDISIRVKIFDCCQRNLDYSFDFLKQKDPNLKIQNKNQFENYDFYQLNIIPKHLREKFYFNSNNFKCSDMHSYLYYESGYYTLIYDDKYLDFLKIPEIYIKDNNIIALSNKNSGDFIKNLGEKINYRCIWCDSLERAEIIHEAYPYLFIKTFNDLPNRNFLIKYEMEMAIGSNDYANRNTFQSTEISYGIGKVLPFLEEAEKKEYLKKRLIGKYDLVWID